MNNYTKQHLVDGIEFSYTSKGNIEVLISPDYGAGWSTWSYNYGINLAVDKRIIDFYKKEGNDVPEETLKEFLKSIGYTEHVCLIGWKKVTICIIEPYCKFKIIEYDGSEELLTFADDDLWELP